MFIRSAKEISSPRHNESLSIYGKGQFSNPDCFGIDHRESCLRALHSIEGTDRLPSNSLVAKSMRASFLVGLVIGFAFISFASDLWAQAGKVANMRAISQRLDRLIERVAAIEKREREILSRQDETIAEIKSLKIVSRR